MFDQLENDTFFFFFLFQKSSVVSVVGESLFEMKEVEQKEDSADEDFYFSDDDKQT